MSLRLSFNIPDNRASENIRSRTLVNPMPPGRQNLPQSLPPSSNVESCNSFESQRNVSPFSRFLLQHNTGASLIKMEDAAFPGANWLAWPKVSSELVDLALDHGLKVPFAGAKSNLVVPANDSHRPHHSAHVYNVSFLSFVLGFTMTEAVGVINALHQFVTGQNGCYTEAMLGNQWRRNCHFLLTFLAGENWSRNSTIARRNEAVKVRARLIKATRLSTHQTISIAGHKRKRGRPRKQESNDKQHSDRPHIELSQFHLQTYPSHPNRYQSHQRRQHQQPYDQPHPTLQDIGTSRTRDQARTTAQAQTVIPLSHFRLFVAWKVEEDRLALQRLTNRWNEFCGNTTFSSKDIDMAWRDWQLALLEEQKSLRSESRDFERS